MFRFGVILVAMAMLFGLTAFALASVDRLPHPARVATMLAGALVLGTWLLMDA